MSRLAHGAVGAAIGAATAVVLAYAIAIGTGSDGPWFFLIPIGLVVGFLAGRSWRTQRRCPLCDSEISAAARVCPHCRAELTAIA